MKQKKVRWSVLLLGIGLTMQAQQTTNATGNNALGSGGTASYSVGQIVYTTNTDTAGSIAQGVQQPYEIAVVLGLDNHHFIDLELAAYPNPTADYLILNTGKLELTTLQLQLYSSVGKLIENRKIASNSEKINLEHLPKGIYFLKVNNNNQETKTFKIIKK
ncbi:T9SS type A sorting domain-containing protein [Flavobacterium crassostreae]|uniref:Secretion system C-terminal sorting domain-containing protein n=1 Tax=Flavobacterium crassostreae TaxID=1763534 RepID=A0A1B9EA04_9FLAO|nr:T9SS type A sorting domain-containing protein [Flavobacterium crassostreae]OCB78762.1 hypothetical protein LPBF_01855 [Flavobacterium crassostreae]